MSRFRSGDKHPMFGKKHSVETKELMSKVQSGNKHPMFGKKLDEETKEKLSLLRKGTRVGIKNFMYGKTPF